MPFTPIETARRVEAAEVTLLRACVDACRRQRPGENLGVVSVGSGAAAYTGPDSPMNKVAGLGFADEGGSVVPAPAELDAVEELFFSRGAPVCVEVSSLADPAILGVLVDRGYRPVGFENVSGRLLGSATGVRAGGEPADGNSAGGLVMERGDAVDHEVWLDVVLDGFCNLDPEGVATHRDFPREALEPAIRVVSSCDGMQCYLARAPWGADGETIAVAGGTMRCTDGIVQLCGASTLPAFRKRGAQTALLDARLADAQATGCDLAVVTTQPGSKSQRNMHKQGFEILYVRIALQREATD